MQQLAVYRWRLRRAADLAEVGRLRAVEWFRVGLLHSVDCGGRGGMWRRIDFAGLVALAIIDELRRRGLSREAIKPISRFVCGLGARRLLRLDRLGMTLLTSAGPQRVRLVSATTLSSATAGGVRIAIDLGPIVAALRNRIQAAVGKPAVKRSTSPQARP